MGKRIVVCCDGTGNSFEKKNEASNVAKLYASLDINDKQLAYYHPGVGTMGSPKSRTAIGREWSKIKGLGFGSGLLPNVGDAYRYLMDTYADGDEIFLLGFSRGAFTARALASLIHVYGLLCAGNHELIPYILRMYSRNSRAAHHGKKVFDADEAFKWQYSHKHPVSIAFCGLWDTVSTYGWVYDPIQLPFLGSNPIIKRGRHAISIDERRCFYKDNLWGKHEQGQDFRQVWFAGVHSDVGGSYPENTSGLAKIALEWMMVEARAAGLGIDPIKGNTVLGKCSVYPPVPALPNYKMPDPTDIVHHSLHGIWWLLELLPQQDLHEGGKRWHLPLGERRVIPPGSHIHESVSQMKRAVALPANYETERWVPF